MAKIIQSDVPSLDHRVAFAQELEAGLIEPGMPFLSYNPSKQSSQVDAVTSASEKLYASQGLVYTYKNGNSDHSP